MQVTAWKTEVEAAVAKLRLTKKQNKDCKSKWMGNKWCQSGDECDQTKAVEETKRTLQIKYAKIKVTKENSSTRVMHGELRYHWGRSFQKILKKRLNIANMCLQGRKKIGKIGTRTLRKTVFVDKLYLMNLFGGRTFRKERFVWSWKNFFGRTTSVHQVLD